MYALRSKDLVTNKVLSQFCRLTATAIARIKNAGTPRSGLGALQLLEESYLSVHTVPTFHTEEQLRQCALQAALLWRPGWCPCGLRAVPCARCPKGDLLKHSPPLLLSPPSRHIRKRIRRSRRNPLDEPKLRRQPQHREITQLVCSVAAILTDAGGKSDKQDRCPVPPSIRIIEGMMSRLYKTDKYLRWTIRMISTFSRWCDFG